MRRSVIAALTILGLMLAAWIGRGEPPASAGKGEWRRVTDGVWRSHGFPTTYAVIHEGEATLIGATASADLDALKRLGAKSVRRVLVTHHDRDSTEQAAAWSAAGIPVLAPKASAPLLTSEGVAAYWRTSLPVFNPEKPPGLRDRSFGVWDDHVAPRGVAGVDCRLVEGEPIEALPAMTVLSAPGHSKDHTAYLWKGPETILFCGDAIATRGKLWAPFSTDWHHCFSEGLDKTAATLRRLATLDAAILCPEHGPPIVGRDAVRDALLETARRAEEASRFKSYEWYTKERVGNPPKIDFLAPDQVATAGEKPWTRLSEHLYLTGNTYALASKDGPVLIIDPFGERIAEQVRTLRDQFQLGPVEVVVISHAHNDHYTGAFLLPGRDAWKVWALDEVARPLAEPFRYRAPYLDPRSLKTDRVFKSGDTGAWREYEFTFRHSPGQTHFTMGFTVPIDGKKCFHTADNFFHHDQFTGSGGWSGRNRSWPDDYGRSARLVLEARPAWILAEHGGPFVFHEEDFRRRSAWGDEATRAANALSPSGQHRIDWDPQHFAIEPLLMRAKPGDEAEAHLVSSRAAAGDERLRIRVGRPDAVAAKETEVRTEAGKVLRHPVKLRLDRTLLPGRHVIPVRITHTTGPNDEPWDDPSDVFFVVEVAE